MKTHNNPRLSTTGAAGVGKSLLTAGIHAESGRNITITDTPGETRFLNDLISGFTDSDLLLLLIDAESGLSETTKQHAFLASLMAVPHLLVVVNKMDLAGWQEDRYREIISEFSAYCEKLKIHDISFVPASALTGDNVSVSGSNMPWYEGPTLLSYLDNLVIASDKNLTDFRFPIEELVQLDDGSPGIMGTVVSGTISPGEDIYLLPAGRSAKIKCIQSGGGELQIAQAGMRVSLKLTSEFDLRTGDMLVRTHNMPLVNTRLDTMLCWIDETAPLRLNSNYLCRHTNREVQAFVRDFDYRVDANTLHRDKAANTLEFNQIGRISIETSGPLFFDPAITNRETGVFFLFDPADGHKVAVGMIRGEGRDLPRLGPDHNEDREKSANVTWHAGKIGLNERIARNGHQPACYWFTGLSGSGKSTLARSFEQKLFAEGKQVFVIDGDNVRHGLNGDLGFTAEDREENIRRIGHVARIMYDAGFIVLCCFISPTRALRDFVRGLFPEGAFNEVHVQCSVEECINRDPKGLYKKALAGEIPNFTGVSAPYEEPERAEFVVDTNNLSVEECVALF